MVDPVARAMDQVHQTVGVLDNHGLEHGEDGDDADPALINTSGLQGGEEKGWKSKAREAGVAYICMALCSDCSGGTGHAWFLVVQRLGCHDGLAYRDPFRRSLLVHLAVMKLSSMAKSPQGAPTCHQSGRQHHR